VVGHFNPVADASLTTVILARLFVWRAKNPGFWLRPSYSSLKSFHSGFIDSISVIFRLRVIFLISS
jgi:hypothetical protein